MPVPASAPTPPPTDPLFSSSDREKKSHDAERTGRLVIHAEDAAGADGVTPAGTNERPALFIAGAGEPVGINAKQYNSLLRIREALGTDLPRARHVEIEPGRILLELTYPDGIRLNLDADGEVHNMEVKHLGAWVPMVERFNEVVAEAFSGGLPANSTRCPVPYPGWGLSTLGRTGGDPTRPIREPSAGNTCSPSGAVTAG